VSYVALPALGIYAVYSLVYETHRGWYSFVISTLTSFVYMFGFVCVAGVLQNLVNLTGYSFQAQLIPQLIINYKLKVSQDCVIVSYTVCSSLTDRKPERVTYANEGDGVQDIVNGNR